jgi:hypothetical protein
MKYVYFLESIDYSDQVYVGLTDDLRARLKIQRWRFSSHFEVQTVAPRHVCCVFRTIEGGRVRTLYEELIRQGLCEKRLR